MPVNVEIPVEKWAGSIRQITLGATAAEGGTRSHTVTVGGRPRCRSWALRAKTPHAPVIAIEVRAVSPADEWPEPLTKAWGDGHGRRCCLGQGRRGSRRRRGRLAVDRRPTAQARR